MSELVLQEQANPGAIGTDLYAFYFNTSGQPCYVGSDGVEHVILYNQATGETPSGTMNGSNPTFVLAHTPIAGSVKLFYNGMRLSLYDAGTCPQGGYTISGATITMRTGFIPLSPTADTLIADYNY